MLDANTLEFLELVDCDPCDVQECEPSRRGIDYSAEAAYYQSPVASNVEIWFGKHKGSTLGMIPWGYVEWLATLEEKKSTRKVIRAAQRLVKER